MSTATKDSPSGGLRVSDADRDRAIAELSEHFQAGRGYEATVHIAAINEWLRPGFLDTP